MGCAKPRFKSMAQASSAPFHVSGAAGQQAQGTDLSFSNAAGQQRARVSTFRSFLLLLLILVGERCLLQRAADALLVGPVACNASLPHW